MSKRKANEIESPRQGNVTWRLSCPERTRAPPEMRMKKAASAQTITASVSSQPAMSCHAGRVNRKKFTGLPKIGSTTLAVRGAYQKSASEGHSAIMAAPVAAATASEMTTAMRRRTGSTGSFTGCPPMRIVCPSGKSGRCARLSATNDPYRMRNVAAPKAAKTSHCKVSDFQNTSPYPNDPNHSRST